MWFRLGELPAPARAGWHTVTEEEHLAHIFHTVKRTTCSQCALTGRTCRAALVLQGKQSTRVHHKENVVGARAGPSQWSNVQEVLGLLVPGHSSQGGELWCLPARLYQFMLDFAKLLEISQFIND